MNDIRLRLVVGMGQNSRTSLRFIILSTVDTAGLALASRYKQVARVESLLRRKCHPFEIYSRRFVALGSISNVRSKGPS